MGHCYSHHSSCHSGYSYGGGCDPCDAPCDPCHPSPRYWNGCQPCHCHSPQIIMYDNGAGYGRKNVPPMCQCGGYIPANRVHMQQQQYYYPPASQIPTYPQYPSPQNPYIQPQQQAAYPASSYPQQQPIQPSKSRSTPYPTNTNPPARQIPQPQSPAPPQIDSRRPPSPPPPYS